VHPYTYAPENRLLTAGGVTYTYDGDGKRVKKSNGTLQCTGPGWDPLLETDLSGNATEEYVFFNGERVGGPLSASRMGANTGAPIPHHPHTANERHSESTRNVTFVTVKTSK
jgi:hypothetical protein